MASWSAWGSDENSMGSVMVCSPFVVVVSARMEASTSMICSRQASSSMTPWKSRPFDAAGRSDGPGQVSLG